MGFQCFDGAVKDQSDTHCGDEEARCLHIVGSDPIFFYRARYPRTPYSRDDQDFVTPRKVWCATAGFFIQSTNATHLGGSNAQACHRPGNFSPFQAFSLLERVDVVQDRDLPQDHLADNVRRLDVLCVDRRGPGRAGRQRAASYFTGKRSATDVRNVQSDAPVGRSTL